MQNSNKIYLFVLIILSVISLTACKSNDKIEISEEVLKEDAEFIKKIETLPLTLFLDYSPLKDLEDIFNSFGDLGPNLIVRCEAISRGETAVIIPLEIYTNEDLRSENKDYVRNAVDCIRTPYEMKIKEVYHGSINKENDIITMIAPYGIIDDFVNKHSDYPIYGVGSEYIFFLRAVEMYGELEYGIVYTPCGWVKLDSHEKTFECSELAQTMYAKYNNNMDKLINDIKKLIKNNNLRTDVESHGDIEGRLEFKRQKNNFQSEDDN